MVNLNVPGYNPAKRKRCVGSAWSEDRPWREGRHVRILHAAYGYGGRIGIVVHVGAERILVRIKLGKRPGDWDVVSYLPKHLRLIQ